MKPVAAIVTMSLACASLAEELQPITLNQIPASYISLGSLVVTLETTTLPDLTRTLGIGELKPNGRGHHDGGDEVCFSYPGGVIRFTSDNEMGGSNRSITDFLVEASEKSPDDCPILPQRYARVRVGGWVKIGDGRALVERHLETTAGRSNTGVRYEFSGATPGNCANVDFNGFDIRVSLEITYRKDSIIRIKGRQLTTC